jgi:DNA-binding transcriptional MerR regulator
VSDFSSLHHAPMPHFADGKALDALRTIGEVSRALGIRQHVLRYWEEQFPMLRPVKRSGGRRYYRPDDVQLIAMIDRLVHKEGYTLRGARQALMRGTSEDAAPVSISTPAPAALASETRERLIAIRRRLEQALASA